jgi:dimeric dUTPase (all-alpha-NTP-PPase superfamily)
MDKTYGGVMRELYTKIAEYQKTMGYYFEDMSLAQRMQAFRNYMLALHIEQAELAAELPWKPWRDINSQPLALQSVQAEEWVDCLFFLFDQALALNLSIETIEKAFDYKLTANMNRISSGYNKKGGI